MEARSPCRDTSQLIAGLVTAPTRPAQRQATKPRSLEHPARHRDQVPSSTLCVGIAIPAFLGGAADTWCIAPGGHQTDRYNSSDRGRLTCNGTFPSHNPANLLRCHLWPANPLSRVVSRRGGIPASRLSVWFRHRQFDGSLKQPGPLKPLGVPVRSIGRKGRGKRPAAGRQARGGVPACRQRVRDRGRRYSRHLRSSTDGER